MNSASFTIRPAELEDAEAIAYVQFAGWQQTYKGIIDDAYLSKMSLDGGIERWKRKLSSPLGYNDFIISAEQKIIGFISVGKARFANQDFDAEIYALYILAEYQGLGAGRDLFLHAQNVFHNMGYGSFCVYVLTKNPALHFYNRFHPHEKIEVEIEIDGKFYQETGLIWNQLLL